MCKPASMTLTKDRVFIGCGHDNHSTIIEENDLNEEGVRGVNVLNVEIEPPFEDYKPLFDAPFEEWTFRVDQDKLPKWHDPERDEKRARAKLAEWRHVNRGNNVGLYNSGDGNSGNRNSGNGNSGNRNSGNGNSGSWNSGNWNSGWGNSGNWNSRGGNSGNWNSGGRNSGGGNSGNWNSGDRNSGCRNSGDRNSGSENSGDFNSGSHCAGFFCSQSPRPRLFNRPVDMDWEELRDLRGLEICYRLMLTKWVRPCEMTEEEKEEHPEAEIRKGYLKTFGYKEAWANLWSKLSEGEKQAVKDLPNFDPKIFEEITGISVGD